MQAKKGSRTDKSGAVKICKAPCLSERRGEGRRGSIGDAGGKGGKMDGGRVTEERK